MSSNIEPKSINEVKLPSFNQAIKKIGPAFVLGAVVLGPGSVFLSSMTGALFGYKLLWILVLSTLFAGFYIEMGSRIGIVMEETFWSGIRNKYGKFVAVLGGFLALCTGVGYMTGNVTGTAAALQLLVGGKIYIWTTVMALCAIVLVSLKGLYGKMEKLMLAIIWIMLLGFVGTLLITGFSPSGAAKGLIPSFPNANAIFLGAGMMATFFSPYPAIYQSYLAKEKGYKKAELGNAVFDAISGTVVVGLLLIIIMFTAAAVLNPAHIIPKSAGDFAIQLVPLAGNYAYLLYGIGLFGAAFSSLTIAAMLGVTQFTDALGLPTKMDDKVVKYLSYAIIAFAWACATIPLLFGGNAVNTVIIAQVATIIGVPLFGWAMLNIANDKKLMGEFRNTTVRNIFAYVGYIVIVGMALNVARTLILPLLK